MPDVLQNLLIYAGSFIVVLSVVVFVHEFGHFQVARWRKVAIDTFSIGFGKTLLGWRDRQGVQWKIGALPLGGYVKFADDADAVSSGPREKIDDPAAMAEARAKGLFHAQSLTTRSLVVAAGPTTNFIFAIFAFALLAFIVGREVPTRITAVAPDSAAEAAGLLPGDVILTVDGRPVANFQELQPIVAGALGRSIDVVIQRGEQQITAQITPRPSASNPSQGSMGVAHDGSFEGRDRIGPLDAIAEGASNTWMIVAQTGAYIGAIFTGRENGNQIAGPIGIINVSGQVANSALSAPGASLGERVIMLALSLLQLAAVLSVAVGIVNLLPIPILDGGHLLFYGIEALRGGKPLPPSAQEWAYRAGFAVMASLFLFATWNDITRLFPGAQ
ncbi:MAG: RIP metalloprotease [Hyphomonadaceae bacterium]